ncbi:hypothetical protein HY085_01410 [Candidatus Gottesmanbacteria bacterium]|nr:hypothetical protein [Candidatus Gottesmanbacteria bacterium]
MSKRLFANFGKKLQYFYLCEYLSGTPKLGDFNESENMKSGNNFYEPLWFTVSKISGI